MGRGDDDNNSNDNMRAIHDDNNNEEEEKGGGRRRREGKERNILVAVVSKRLPFSEATVFNHYTFIMFNSRCHSL